MHLTAFLMSFFALEINLQARASCTQNLIMYWCGGVEADGRNLKVNKTGNSIKWKIQQVATPESKLVTRHSGAAVPISQVIIQALFKASLELHFCDFRKHNYSVLRITGTVLLKSKMADFALSFPTSVHTSHPYTSLTRAYVHVPNSCTPHIELTQLH